MAPSPSAPDKPRTAGRHGNPPVAKRYLILFFVLTIPLATLFWGPMILIRRGTLVLPFEVPALLWSTLGALSPLIALGLLQRISRQRVRLGDLFRQIRPRELFHIRVLAGPVLVFGLHLLLPAAAFAFRASSAEGPLQLFNAGVRDTLGGWIWLILPVHFAAALFTSPLFEEPGWRAFSFDNLRRYLPRDLASLLVGSYWWLWHQGMNLAFDQPPTLFGYASMLLDSFLIDAAYTLSRRNLLAAMLTHQAMGTAFIFLAPVPALWWLLAFKVAAVAGLRAYAFFRDRTA